ncbi:hypothetical protein ACFU9O_06280 [Streptomyces albidoflavus]|uniref:hypothetical protein n=1 Tax=Streptomyces TaxID=1883 RepID=UPI0003A0937D|nr:MULTISPECIES: hypothetical protein [Streptomyces]NUW05912.1 hypothetical protein [Streptomyces sp. CAI-21]NVI28750.1 hypothetical protein [Streptomyces sp. CAI-17]SCE07493.1 hypothetical protein GA0115236_134716 [Streptomyces sp. IgraMP-1]MBO1286586.1 hypothetical protein [Streptomyces sampsonii]MCO6696903.1 hypothetical protein [Streptomyces sp. Vc17.3-30]
MEQRTFTLGYWEDRSGHRLDSKFGYRGEASSFGRIEVIYPARRDGGHHVTEVTGDRVPTTAFDGWAYVRTPSLFFASLTVGGAGVRLRRNRWAQTRAGRAVKMQVEGKSYRYQATSGGTKNHALIRDGVEIRTQHHGRGKAKKVTFTITGAATPTDVALAAVMVGVDTRNLTRNGAIRSVFSRSLTWLD